MNILILGPYPIVQPQHGGAIRASRITDLYRAAGHNVNYVGLYDPSSNIRFGPMDVALMPQVVAAAGRMRLPMSIALWRALAQDAASFTAYLDIAKAINPDIIQFEEPNLWPVVKRLVSSLGPDVKLIHSSYNFESKYQKEMLELQGMVADDIVRLIQADEQEIARKCDLIFVVSQDDRADFMSMGARSVYIAANGAGRLTVSDNAREVLRAYTGGAPYALYVSSAHLPNAKTLGTMTAGGAASPLRTGKIFIAGTISNLLKESRELNTNPVLNAHARILGRVDNDILGALYREAKVVILPKLYGGGSNLKTAEALISGRPVVATSGAFIGFEDNKTLEGVVLSDEPRAFWQAVEDALVQPLQPDLPPMRREALLWSTTLQPMAEALARLER